MRPPPPPPPPLALSALPPIASMVPAPLSTDVEMWTAPPAPAPESDVDVLAPSAVMVPATVTVPVEDDVASLTYPPPAPAFAPSSSCFPPEPMSVGALTLSHAPPPNAVALPPRPPSPPCPPPPLLLAPAEPTQGPLFPTYPRPSTLMKP